MGLLGGQGAGADAHCCDLLPSSEEKKRQVNKDGVGMNGLLDYLRIVPLFLNPFLLDIDCNLKVVIRNS
jgi:hypothetical protein